MNRWVSEAPPTPYYDSCLCELDLDSRKSSGGEYVHALLLQGRSPRIIHFPHERHFTGEIIINTKDQRSLYIRILDNWLKGLESSQGKQEEAGSLWVSSKATWIGSIYQFTT